MKVAYQGIRGAYSEEAGLRHFGSRCVMLGHELSAEAVDAVEKGRADCGILPVENSIAGPVGVNTDLLLSRNVAVIGEIYLPIRHCLLASHGTTLKNIASVYSHPVAIAQCSSFLRRHKLKAIPEYDTAGAAELVARRAVTGEAAIASERCARIYGLKILTRNISSESTNITRFLAFSKAGRVPHGLNREKTSLAFTAKHKPGALLRCLQRFADHGINLTRLESRPVPKNPFAYVFFVDFMGGTHAAPVKAALLELARDARRIKILGSYPAGRRPNSGR